MDKLSYALGLGIGQQLAQMGASDISAEDFAQAIKDVLEGKELKVSHREAQTIVQDYFALLFQADSSIRFSRRVTVRNRQQRIPLSVIMKAS